jgi:hypothetical protein
VVNCSNQLAGDPDFGQRKYCRISYHCNGGTSQEVRIEEGERRNLSCRSDANATPRTDTDRQQGYPAHAAATSEAPEHSVAAVKPEPPTTPPSAYSSDTGPSMKPGLWQVDRGDALAANKPASPDIAINLCVTPEMIAHGQTPFRDRIGQASCSPIVTTRRGESTVYESRCRVNGMDSSLVVESSIDGNSIITSLDATPPAGDARSAPAVHSRTRMSYLGPDCRVNYPAPKEDVPSRRLRYEATFSADGKRYQLHTDYECRFESHTGPEGGYQVRSWTLNGTDRLIRMVDTLPDGEPLTVLPKNLYLRLWSEDIGPCPMNVTSVRSQIVAALGPEPATLERFDPEHVEFMRHHVALLDSRIVPLPAQTAAVTPVPGGASARPDSPEKSYYSINAIVVPLSSVAARAGLKEFVLQKHIPWLSRGQSYAFQQWTDDDVHFARDYMSIFTTEDDSHGKLDVITPGLVVCGATRDGNDWKVQRDKPQRASQWIPIPAKAAADELRLDVPGMTKVWVNYEGARIEVALFGYYRLVYDPERDELIQLDVDKLSF